MPDSATVFVKGRVFWAKIIGDKALHQNYEGTGRQWSYEFEPADTSFLKEHKLLDRLKDKEDAKNPDKGAFLNLRKPEFDKDGNKNDPIRVYNSDDTAWDEEVLLGNGTAVDAKLKVVDWGKGKKKSIFTTALRVTEHVPYVSNEFSGMGDAPSKPTKTRAGKAGATAKSAAEYLDDLDDDIPF
jgi:hypothetical protein